MVFAHAVIAVLLAGVSVAILVLGLRARSPWATGPLFLVLFLATWAGGIWMAPFGPTIWNVYWLPFLLIAVMTAVLVVAVAPLHGRDATAERERGVEEGLGLFFWILIGGLVLAVVGRYL